MNCQFLVPINLGEEFSPDWEYSQIECEPLVYELIVNPSTEAEFYLSKTITYGDFLIVWFLVFFLLAWISKSVFNYFWKK